MKTTIKSFAVVLGTVGALSFTALAANAATVQAVPSASGTAATTIVHPLGCGGAGEPSCNN
jgi:hypothetical protein